MIKRLIFSFCVLFSVLFLPFYVSVVLVIFGMFYFSFFVEGIVFLLISDFLYGSPQERFSSGLYVSFLSASIGLILIEFIKDKLKFYSK